MNEEQYFLEAINASEPNADLIYADWLEEQGKPETDEIRDPTAISLQTWSNYRSWSRFNHQSFSCSKYYHCRSCSRALSGLYSISRSRSDSIIRNRSWSWSKSYSC